MPQKTVKKDGGGRFRVVEETTVADLKRDRELQPDDVVYQADTLQRVGEGDKLLPGREFGATPANDLG